MSLESAADKLDAALECEDLPAFMAALVEILKARGGLTAAAHHAGLNRTALYKILSASGNPGLRTLDSLLSLIGLRLAVKLRADPKGSAAASTEIADQPPKDA